MKWILANLTTSSPDFKVKSENLNIPGFEVNKNIIAYCSAILKSKSSAILKYPPVQEDPWHEFLLEVKYFKYYADHIPNAISWLRIIHHNGIDTIDEIDAVKGYEDDSIKFTYRQNEEFVLYEPGKYWYMADQNMDWFWLEKTLKLATIQCI